MYIRIQISRQKIKLDQYALDPNLVPELFDGHAHLLAHRLGVFQLPRLRNSQQPRLATKPPTTMYQNYTSTAYIYIYMCVCVCVIYISYIYICLYIHRWEQFKFLGLKSGFGMGWINMYLATRWDRRPCRYMLRIGYTAIPKDLFFWGRANHTVVPPQ